MDLYDPQTLGVMVFGGFMLVSALGIFLVSTFSMKETSYEEALAKQRKESEKNQQPKVDKKKKEKLPEKKGKAKKKDEKPNGTIPEHEPNQESTDSTKAESARELILEKTPVPVVPVVPVEVPIVPVVAPVPKKSASGSEKAALAPQKAAPAPQKAAPAPQKAAPAPQKAAPAPQKAAPAPQKAAPAPQKAAPAPQKAAPAPQKAAPAPQKAAPAPQKAAPAPQKAAPVSVKSVPVSEKPAPVPEKSAPVSEKSAPSPKDKKKKTEKKVLKVEPSPIPAVAFTQAVPSKHVPVLAAPTKEVPVIAVSPVGSQPLSSTQPPKKAEATVNQEDSKQEAVPKKKSAPKKKTEPSAEECEGAVYIPYKTLVPTIQAMCFSKGEAQKLIEILADKYGIMQDTWQTATQKGDPMTALKRVVEEKEKLLLAQHEKTNSYKEKFVEINKELQSEKSKSVKEQSKFKEQLVTREQENHALQARMQASYQDHVNETQQLQAKVRSLQEEIENGPKAQLTRLQQENSILRDALNQATSQTESKQNAELAKLRQECSKLSKELTEKSESLQQEEQRRKSLDGKISSYEKQITQLQTLQQEGDATLQKRLDEVNEELRKSQNSYQNLLADTEKAKAEQKNHADLQTKLQSYEAEGKQKSEKLDDLNKQLQETTGENAQLMDRIKSIEALLEAGHNKDADNEKQQQQEAKEGEIALAQLQARLQEKDSQIASLEKEAAELKEAVEQQKNKNNDLREKNWQAMEALGLAEKTCEEKLNSEKKAKEEMIQQLNAVQTQTKETLQSLLPQTTIVSQQSYSEWLQEFRQSTSELLSQQTEKDSSSELQFKLKEAEDAQSALQAECEQYRTILGETEAMLKALQKSVEEEEQVWKAKLTASEEDLKKSHSQVKTLEETVEKLRSDIQSTEQLKECISLMEAQLESQMNAKSTECQTYSKEIESLQQLLSESQEHLDATKAEARKQSIELSLLRQQLGEIQNHVNDTEKHGSQNMEVPKANCEDQSTLAEMQEKSVHSLQEELEKLKSTEEPSSGTDEVQQIKGVENKGLESLPGNTPVILVFVLLLNTNTSNINIMSYKIFCIIRVTQMLCLVNNVVVVSTCYITYIL
ncbi:ribosome-binding protein 1 isoform X2 [Xenopus laevis]|uniref:Ribosome-binding protein 1 isoform X2 n=1 Tax=Xenopus laevis TaxID=8355 RepID=A0A8J1KL47_XENLA|nr:ribosome-binding protein 1 isoform X2 [Xenopus laevis]